jgi:hypothetical protein
MAERDIVGSLFGMTPESYQQGMNRRDSATNLTAAQLTPGQLAGFYAMEAGTGLGRATQGLLGVEDPQMQLISRTNQLVQEIGIDTPEKLRTLAGELQKLPGGAQLASQAVQQANKMLESAATVTAKTREQLPTIAKLQSYRENLVAQLGPNDPRVKEVDAIIRAEGEGRGTKIVMPAGETEASKTIGKGVGEKVLATAASGEAGADNLIKINETLNELRTNKAFTGSFSDLQTNIAKVQAKFAADKEAGKRVTDTEYLDALLGADVFPMISSLGIGAKGLDTPAEREFLRKVMTGTVALERDTLIKLTETRKNIAERAVKKYNEKVDSGELNEYFKIKGTAPRKIDIPKSDDSAALGADYEDYARYWVGKGKTPKTREQYIQDKRNLQGGKP